MDNASTSDLQKSQSDNFKEAVPGAGWRVNTLESGARVAFAFASVLLTACQPGGSGSNLRSELAKCHAEAEQRYPRPEIPPATDLYHVFGPAADYAETCMKIAGFGFGGEKASSNCFQAPISSRFKPTCYWRDDRS